MSVKITSFDVSEYLDDKESIAAYLNSIFEEGDPELLLAAIGDIAKAKGMSKIASDSGLSRESLYKALDPHSKTRFETVLRVLNSLGVKIGFNAISENEKKQTKKNLSEKKTTQRRQHLRQSRTTSIKQTSQNKRMII